MSIETLPKPAESDTDSPQLVHAVCRNCWPKPVPEQLGMCGTPPSTPAMDPRPDPNRPWCAVCMELYPKPCQWCGR